MPRGCRRREHHRHGVPPRPDVARADALGLTARLTRPTRMRASVSRAPCPAAGPQRVRSRPNRSSSATSGGSPVCRSMPAHGLGASPLRRGPQRDDRHADDARRSESTTEFPRRSRSSVVLGAAVALALMAVYLAMFSRGVITVLLAAGPADAAALRHVRPRPAGPRVHHRSRRAARGGARRHGAAARPASPGSQPLRSNQCRNRFVRTLQQR